MNFIGISNRNLEKFATLISRINKGLKWKYRNHSNHTAQTMDTTAAAALIDFQGKWPTEELNAFIEDMRIVPNFISADEEAQLLEEIEPYMRRLHYEFDHWDDAIHGFRETERKHWYPTNRAVMDRVRELAFNSEIMPYVHVLDLAEEGVIKPHVDSTRFCGSTIAGISLLSECVMRLVRTDEKKFQQKKIDDTTSEAENGDYRNQPTINLDDNFYADILLQRRSLYIMSNSSRYNFTHEVLGNETSKFRGKAVYKGRRISIICRNNPEVA